MKKMLFAVHQLILRFFRVFTVTLTGGTECIVCGGFSHIMPLCKKCRGTVFDVSGVLEEKRCSVCGKTLVSEKDICMECRGERVFKNTNRVIPLYIYNLWNKELLFLWKISGIRSLSPFFAEKLAFVLGKTGCNYVIPVPPRKGKIRKKGWDQIEELCSFLEFRYGFVVLRLLERNSESPEQKKLGRESRLENIGKSYSMIEGKKLQKELKKTGGVIPESCFLIDDILTTGSTAESCACVLKEGGVKTVNVMALFTAS